jgi:hypothetical protein
MGACGLWTSGRRIVGAVVDDDGRTMDMPLIATNDDERWELLVHVDAVHGLDCLLVVPDNMLRHDSICRFAIERRHVVWVAPCELVQAIRRAAALDKASRIAAMIARLALVPAMRQHLRRVERICCDCRQLPLL